MSSWNQAASDALAPAPRNGVKVPAFVSVLAVLLVASAAAWLLWSQVYRFRPVDVSQFEPNNTRGGRARTRAFNAQSNTNSNVGAGVLLRADGSGDVHTAAARARFTRAGGNWLVNIAFIDQRFIPANDRLAVAARFTAMTAAAQGIKTDITPEQVAKLRELNISNEMTVNDADRKALAELWATLQRASDAAKPGIEKNLISAFGRITTAAATPTIKTAADNAAKIRQILSPTQIAAVSNRRAG